VCPTQADIIIKTTQRIIPQTTEYDSARTLISSVKDLGEIPTESAPTGRTPNTGGRVKTGDFRPISRNVLETMYDGDIYLL